MKHPTHDDAFGSQEATGVMPDPAQRDRTTDPGDVGHMAEQAWIRLIAGAHPDLVDAVPESLEKLRQSLLSPDADALERLVVDQLCLCWLQSNYLSCFTAESAQTAKQLRFLHGQYLKAQRRFQFALRTLVQHRRSRRAARKPSSRPRPTRLNVDE